MFYEGDGLVDTAARYLLQMVATAILCGIFVSSTEKSAFAKQIKLLAGLVLTISVMKPLGDLKSINFSAISYSLSNEAAAAISEGEKAADDALHSLITEKTCAYIQEKAEALGVSVAVEVTATDRIPDRVTLTGNVSPYVRMQLTQWIENELGITEEAQHWK